jgi:hypothetical protein
MLVGLFWSGRGDSNARPSPWQNEFTLFACVRRDASQCGETSCAPTTWSRYCIQANTDEFAR